MGRILDTIASKTPEELKLMKESSPVKWARLMQMATAERGREDFWFFLREIVRNQALYEPLHRPIAEWLEPQGWGNKRKKMILIPRGHMKSAIATIAFALWNVVKNRNIRILIVSHKAADSGNFLRAIKDIMSTDRFQEVYPDIYPKIGIHGKPSVWGTNAILVERDLQLAQNTIETSSIDAQVTGRHYDIIIFDDLVTADSVRTPDLIRKTEDYHKHCQSLLDPGAYELVVGTRYDYGDEYGRIIADCSEQYDILIKSVLDDDGEPIWPSRYSAKPLTDQQVEDGMIFLDDLKAAQGSFIFNAQYHMDPVDPTTQIFKEDQFEIVHSLPNCPLNWFRVCDLSSEKHTEDSFTAIVTGCVDNRGTIYITDVFWGQYTPIETINELIRGQQVCEEERPMVVGFEPGPYERQIMPFLEREMVEKQTFIPRKFLDEKQAMKPKDERIRGFQPFVESGKVKILSSCRNKDELLDEFIRFPRYVRKDVADACAQISHVMFNAPQEKTLEPSKQRRDSVGRAFASALGRREDVLGNDRVMDQRVSGVVNVGSAYD